MFASCLTYDNHEKLLGCAVTVQRNEQLISGRIIATSYSNCTVKFTDGTKQKFLWGQMEIRRGS